MKKFNLISILMVVMMIAVVALAATTKVLVATEPGTREVSAFNVGKPVHLEAIGCLPTSSSVTVYRVTGTVTNEIADVGLTSGAYNAVISSTNYLLAGDDVIFGGTYTSGVVRLIITAD